MILTAQSDSSWVALIFSRNLLVVDCGEIKGTSATPGNSMPSWSQDGKWIYFTNGGDVSNPSVWKVPWSGGRAVQIAQVQATYPIESPDGQHVYFFRNKGLWRVKTDGSGEEAVKGMPELNSWGDKWFPFGSGIYFMNHPGAKDAIEFFDLTTEKVRRVYELEKPAPG